MAIEDDTLGLPKIVQPSGYGGTLPSGTAGIAVPMAMPVAGLVITSVTPPNIKVIGFKPLM
jgi:hypothetical protein